MTPAIVCKTPNFYPRPPRGGRRGGGPQAGHQEGDFYPRPPRGGRQAPPWGPCPPGKNFYPRPPRGGRPQQRQQPQQRQAISTHALREEGDGPWCVNRRGKRAISTHALREEGDATVGALVRQSSGFLPTPSARRATCSRLRLVALSLISTHALREEGDRVTSPRITYGLYISTHALREEGDAERRGLILILYNFYPRPPRGGRPPTHPLTADIRCNFYPRPPRGGRHHALHCHPRPLGFLPTPSARRATARRRRTR